MRGRQSFTFDTLCCATLESLEPRLLLTTDIAQGLDLFVTPAGGTSIDFSVGPIPAGFFGPASDPFDGVVHLQGTPLNQFAGDPIGRTDTIVQRLDNTSGLVPGGSDTVPIEIVALSLVSIEPITVTSGGGMPELWDVRVTLSDLVPQQQGQMRIHHEGLQGGTFESSLPVVPRFIFTPSGGGAPRVVDPAPPKFFNAQGSWVHQADPEFHVIQVGAGLQVDGDGDGMADDPVLTDGTSNFAPGIAGLPVDPMNAPKFQIRDLIVHEVPDARHTVTIAQRPDVSLRKVDRLEVDVDGDSQADPGDTLRYRFDVQSSLTAGDATGLLLSDLLPPDTSFVPGSLQIGPHASRDIFASLGGLPLNVDDAARGLLANDFDIDGVTPQNNLIARAETKSTLLGGTVQIDADGTFAYDPPVDVSHMTDAFQYTISDSDDLSSSGWAHITIGGTIWFVDNSVVGPGTGTLADPFSDFSQLNGPGGVGDVDKPGDAIFVFEGNSDVSPYDVALDLEDNQHVIGEGAGLTLGGHVLIPPVPLNRPVLDSTTGPTIQLGRDNVIKGFSVFNSAAMPGIVGDEVGVSLIVDVDFSSRVELNSLSFAPGAVTFQGSPIDFSGTEASFLAAGNYGISIFDSGIRNMGGGPGLVLAPPLAGPMLGPSFSSSNLEIETTGGTALDARSSTWSSAVVPELKQTGGNNAGVHLENNTGTITFGHIEIDTSNGAGIFANSGGVINVTGMGNTVNTTTGIGLDIRNTEIGVSGLTFESIRSNGATSGIVLQNTGTLGGLTITGDGTAGSGGSIQNSTGAGVVLDNSHNITLTDLTVGGTAAGQHAVTAGNVDGLTLDRVSITAGMGNSSALSGNGIRNLRIENQSILDGGAVTPAMGTSTVQITNLLGVSVIDNSTIRNGKEHNLFIQNDDASNPGGVPDVLHIRNATQFQNALGGDHLRARTFTTMAHSGNLQLVMSDASVKTLSGPSFNGAVFESSGNSRLFATLADVDITGNVNNALRLQAIENSRLVADVSQVCGLTRTSPMPGAVIDILSDGNLGGGGAPRLDMTLARCDQILLDPGVVLSNPGNGVQAFQLGSGMLNIKIDQFSIAGNAMNTTGIALAAANGNGQLNAHVTNTNINLPSPASLDGIFAQSGNTAADTSVVRLNLQGNNAVATRSGYLLNHAIAGSVFELQDFVGNGMNPADVQAWVNNAPKNNAGTVLVQGAMVGGGFSPTAGMVPMPDLPPVPPAPGAATAAPDEPVATTLPQAGDLLGALGGEGVASGTVIIDPNEPGEPGTGINLGKGGNSTFGGSVSNGIASGTPSPGTPPADDPPMVSFVAPLPGATIVEGSTVTFEVDATDDVGVTVVELFVDDVLRGSDTTLPFEFQLPFPFDPLAPRPIELRVRAVDTVNQEATATQQIMIVEDQPPQVTLTSPSDGHVLLEGSSVLVEVTATDDVRVQRVEFYRNGMIVDIDSTIPFERAIQVPTMPGIYTLEVRAVDSAGQASTDSIDVTATPAPLLMQQALGDVDFGTRIELRFDAVINRVPTTVLGLAGHPTIENTANVTFEEGTAQADDPRPDIAVGAEGGILGGNVKSVDNLTATEFDSFFAFEPAFAGGVRVATGDVNGDGLADIITGAGPGGGPHVRVFDGQNTSRELASFFAYDPSFTGGVFVAAGDINGDGRSDIITGSGAGAGPHVKVFDGITGTEIRSFFAYDMAFTGGVSVATGDVNGDGRADIITGAGPGAPGGHVKVFDGVGGAELHNFFAFDPGFAGGVFVAAGDINRDTRADIVVGAGPGAPGGHVRAFSGQSGAELANFFAYDPAFTGGVRVAVGDLTHDDRPDIIVGRGPDPSATLPQVNVFGTRRDGSSVSTSLLDSFFAFDPGFTGGVFVASGNFQSSNATLTSVPSANLRVQVADIPDPVVAGTQLTYTVDVINDGPSTADNVRLTMLVPTGTTHVMSNTTTGSYDPATGRWLIGTMPPGTETLTLTVLVDQAVIGPIRALPLVTSTTHDPNRVNNIVMPSTTVTREVDLAVTLLNDDPDPVIAGNQLTYEMEVTNFGPSLATGGTLTFTPHPSLILLPGQSLIPGTGITPLPSGDFELDLPDLGVGGTAFAVLVFAVDANFNVAEQATGTLTVQSTETDTDSGNDSDSETTTVVALDFGDALDTGGGPAAGNPYPTLLEHNGARHVIGALRFGSLVDPEGDGQPTPTADGDDQGATDDEDGLVSASRLAPGTNASVTLNVQGTGGTLRHINAWIDFANDGSFAQVGDQIASDVQVAADGNVTLNFAVPNTAASGNAVARFRISTAAGLGPAGLADDGEVEDHLLLIQPRLTNLVVDVTPGVINENQKVTLNGSFDSANLPHTINVSWGDGTSSSQTLLAGVTDFSMMHTYHDDDPSGTPVRVYPILVTVQNSLGDFLADLSQTVQVNNVPPNITSLMFLPAMLNEGGTTQLVGTFGDPGPLDTFSLEVDWDGNGTFDTTIAVSGGSFAVGHTYPDDPTGPDTFNVNVRLSDDDTGATTQQIPITVNNVAPIVDAGPNAASAVGSPFQRTIAFTDPGADSPWGIFVDWGDGTPILAFNTSSKMVPLTHTYTTAGTSTVTVTIDDGDGGVGSDSFTVLRPGIAQIRDVHLFYNSSRYDNNGPQVTQADNAALATDIDPLRFGGTGGLVHTSGYFRGINGVFIDSVNFPAGAQAVTAADIMVQVGTTDFPDTWPMGPAPTAVGVLPGAGVGGSDRIFVTFADRSIINTWFRLTVKATPNTGLAMPEDYFFGALSGETGASILGSGLSVDAGDLLWVARNLTPLNQPELEPVTERADLEKSGRNDAIDFLVIARNLRAQIPNISPVPGGMGMNAVATQAAIGQPLTELVLPSLLGEGDHFFGQPGQAAEDGPVAPGQRAAPRPAPASPVTSTPRELALATSTSRQADATEFETFEESAEEEHVAAVDTAFDDRTEGDWWR